MKKLTSIIAFFTVFTASAQTVLQYTGWDTEGIKGDVESMSTNAGKEVKFDSFGNITSITEKYRSAVSVYSDPLHYTSETNLPMEVTFPDKFTRLEKGATPDGKEVFRTYRFDQNRRITNIFLDDVNSVLHIEYVYTDLSPFPDNMEIKFIDKNGEWMEYREFLYWSFDYTGNWRQRMVTGWSKEPDGEREEFEYTEMALYNYRHADPAQSREIPDLISYRPHHLETLVTTGYDGVYSLFDYSYRLGWTMFLFIPKEGPAEWLSRQMAGTGDGVYNPAEREEALLDRLSERSLRELSEEFDIYAYNIPKEDQLYYPMGDSPYEPDEPHTEYVYRLDYDNDRCILLESFSIEPGDEFRLWPWLEELLESRYNQIK